MCHLPMWLVAYRSAADLQAAIEAQLPDDLRGRIDVYVLDVSPANDIPA
nr:hypothetical protein [Phaeobacter gallaeciensis]